MSGERFAYCEPVWATPTSHEHIRMVKGDLKLGGGIIGWALCGMEMTRGWDLQRPVDPAHFERLLAAQCNPLCPRCAAAADAYLATPARPLPDDLDVGGGG